MPRGHEVHDIRGSEKEGLRDEELFLLAQESQAVLLTTDRDFFHTIPHIHPNHAGVIVIALQQPNRQGILERLSWLLDHVSMEQLAARAFLLRDTCYVVRPPMER